MTELLSTLPRAETADRSRLIGASEVAAVLGLHPNRTPFGVWAEKCDPQPQEESDVLDRGNFLESGVIRWAGKKLGVSEIEPGIPLHEPGILASACVSVRPDSVFHWRDRQAALVEAKTSDVDGYSEDDVPEYVRVQALVQLAAVPVDRVYVPAYLPIRRKFVVPFVERDDALIARILELVAEWHYRHLDPHGPLVSPPVDGSEACSEWLKRRHPDNKGPLREGTLAEAELAVRYAQAKAAQKAAEEAAKALGNELRLAIGDDEGLTFGEGGKVTFKTQAGARRLSAEQVKANFPDAYAACLVQGAPVRVLRLGLKGLKDE